MTELHIDFETRSTVELKKTGAHVYAEHPSTDLWCAAYAFGDGPVFVWMPGQPCPGDIFEHVLSGGVCVAHNAAFERTIWHYILGQRYGWPEPDVTQWRCTLAMAYAMALPGALDDAAAALGMDHRKDSAGYRLMLQMSRPRKKMPLTWWDVPEKVERLVNYCKQDVEVERALGKRLRPLKQSELDLWHLDQRINDRGVAVDVALAEAARKIVKAHASKLDIRMAALTAGAVSACSNRNQLIAWCREKGVDTESIAKDVVEELLADKSLPDDVRAVLNLRREAAKASVAKIDALLLGRNKDGRARGLTQFHAASTGRWGGRRFQPQNIKRPEREDDIINEAIEIVGTGDVELVEAIFDEPLSVVGDCLRGMVIATDGHEVMAADYSNIEGRCNAWLAGETWKVEAFKAYDRGEGPDLYKVTAAEIRGKHHSEVTKDERQAYGKVPELALGYQGGVGAFQTMAVNYGVEVTDDEAAKIRDGWRAKHPNIKQLWYDLEAAAIAAIDKPGSTHYVAEGRIVFRRAGSFLFMRLPSGRFLAYAYPELAWKTMPWFSDDAAFWVDAVQFPTQESVEAKFGKGAIKFLDADRGMWLVREKVKKLAVSFMGVDTYTRQWQRCFTYGGSLDENAIQAIARDILAAAMPKLEAAGYPIILHVHDEIVAEPRIGHGSLKEFESIMCDLPSWAAGCPISAEGFTARRYRK